METKNTAKILDTMFRDLAVAAARNSVEAETGGFFTVRLETGRVATVAVAAMTGQYVGSVVKRLRRGRSNMVPLLIDLMEQAAPEAPAVA